MENNATKTIFSFEELNKRILVNCINNINEFNELKELTLLPEFGKIEVALPVFGAIEVALQMISSIDFLNHTSDDIRAITDYLYSIESIVPAFILKELWKIVAKIDLSTPIDI